MHGAGQGDKLPQGGDAMKGGAAAAITVIALVMLAFIIAFPRVAAGVYTVSLVIFVTGLAIEGLKNE